ncbi:MAG: glycosyltransferase [Xanthobacteraceae bacterium]|nr:glycosyltransferase [Xanthobacteraceae bacterium]
MADLSTLRIVAINTPHMAAAFPDQTQTFLPMPLKPDAGWTKLSVPNFGTLYGALRDPGLSLIVTSPSQLAPWHMLMRTLFDRRSWSGQSRFGPGLGPHLLRLPVRAPIAVIDTGDFPYINRADLFLLKRCRFYFKRELPPDHWRLFTKTVHREHPTRRFRQGNLRPHIDKLRPISLGLPPDAIDPPDNIEKTSDIFYAGAVEGSSTVRRSGLREIVALRDRGLRVDIPEGRLPRQEFYLRCAQAWLVWSPEGLGWDCFRHYEALACGAVPLINQPTIERYRPLVQGVHALYYDPEPGFLTQAVEAALADKDRLRSIAREGKAHVMAHHTMTAIANYVLQTTLGASADRT